VQSPSPEPFIPPPPPFIHRPSIGQHFYQHHINGLPALGVISDPIFVVPLLPNGPFVSYFTLHICKHARLIHTQTFCLCTDVRTGAMFQVPWYNLSEVITAAAGTKRNLCAKLRASLAQKHASLARIGQPGHCVGIITRKKR
jgi:hypothetical protein